MPEMHDPVVALDVEDREAVAGSGLDEPGEGVGEGGQAVEAEGAGAQERQDSGGEANQEVRDGSPGCAVGEAGGQPVPEAWFEVGSRRGREREVQEFRGQAAVEAAEELGGFEDRGEDEEA